MSPIFRDPKKEIEDSIRKVERAGELSQKKAKEAREPEGSSHEPRFGRVIFLYLIVIALFLLILFLLTFVKL